MIPVPIPDDKIWAGAVRRVVGPPSGDPTDEKVRAIEALFDRDEDGHIASHVMLELEPGDLEKLQGGGNVWISFLGAIRPFSVVVTDRNGD